MISGIVSAKVASGLQNFALDLQQEQSVSKYLLCQEEKDLATKACQVPLIKAAKKCLQGGGVTTTSASKASRSQTTPRKHVAGKAITAQKAVAQPEMVKEKEEKQKE